MKITIVGIILGFVLFIGASVVPANAYPAVDSYGVAVERITIDQAESLWYNYNEPDGFGDMLVNDYRVHGLMIPAGSDYGRPSFVTSGSMASEMPYGWGVIEYLSKMDELDGSVAMYYNEEVGMVDVYEPGTAMF